MYDAVWLYALAVNETLEAGQSIRNGLEVAKRTYNRLYEGTFSAFFSYRLMQIVAKLLSYSTLLFPLDKRFD